MRRRARSRWWRRCLALGRRSGCTSWTRDSRFRCCSEWSRNHSGWNCRLKFYCFFKSSKNADKHVGFRVLLIAFITYNSHCHITLLTLREWRHLLPTPNKARSRSEQIRYSFSTLKSVINWWPKISSKPFLFGSQRFCVISVHLVLPTTAAG